MLSDGVGPETAQRKYSGHRGGVDHVTLISRRQYARNERTDAVDHTPQVYVDNSVPLLERDLPRVSPSDDPGVVHRHMERPVALDGDLAEALDGIGISHIDHDCRHVTARAHEPRRLAFELFLVEVRHDHPHPVAHEGFDERQTDSTGRAGNNRSSPFESFHVRRMLSAFRPGEPSDVDAPKSGEVG